MTKGEIFIRVLIRVTGKPEQDVRELLGAICAANPKIAAGFAPEVPEDEAQRQIEKMILEGPGIIQKLMKGAEEVSAFESKSVH